MLKLRKEHNFIVAVYLGQVKLIGALFDIDGELVCREQLYEGVKAYDKDQVSKNISALTKNVIENLGVSRKKMMLIGVAAPGTSNYEKCIMFEQKSQRPENGDPIPNNLRSIKLIENIENHFHLLVLIDNNSNLAALAQFWFGFGLNTQNFVVYTIRIGISGDAILDGNLYGGQDNIVCKIGHTTIGCHGGRCFCGNRGCLEQEGRFRY